MKIAIVRAASLNQAELQNYQPLSSRHHLLAIGSKKPIHDISSIQIPISKLLCLGDLFSNIPFGIKALYRLFGDPQYLLNFNQAVASFDIVHTAEIASLYSYQAIQARNQGLVKSVVVTVWENIPHLGNDNPKRKFIKQQVIKGTDKFLAVTDSAKNALIQEGANPNKIEVIPMGVDTAIFRPSHPNSKLQQKLGLNPSKTTILFVGRLVYEKGPYTLLEALKKLSKRLDWQMLMIGAGPEKNRLISQIKTAGLSDRIQLIDSQPYLLMPGFYHLADFLVLPSIPTPNWQEQYGMVIVEAMASGKAVIISSGSPEEVVGKAGIVVPQNSTSALTQALTLLLDDHTKRYQLGKLARKRAGVFLNSSKISLKIEQLYQSINQ